MEQGGSAAAAVSSQFRLGKVKGCLLPDAACIDNAFIELADLSLF